MVTAPLSLIAVKYGETEIKRSMAFADAVGDDRKVPISLIVYVIREGDRLILVDAGCDTMPGYPLFLHVSPAKALADAGIDPLAVTDLILTHSHHDHAEAAVHFKNATVYIHEQECAKASEKGFLPVAARVVAFGERLQVGPACILPWGGHSLGSSLVCLSYGGREYVMCGDECYCRVCLLEGRPTGVSKNPTQSRAFIERFSDPKYTVLPAHDETLLPGKLGFVKMI